ncbi:acyl carrier protein [Limibaculum sp. FT325]|uniref:acyl carrier protein n=1 Tax=Thermohalobaculum sediminis TaxID=2939436 RepID=UPI0020BD96ED|nr:acyl carrier protein [Limibaculum sediminis]MCL5778851.1 acyl carrier protein [Limibaculum sediminis]
MSDEVSAKIRQIIAEQAMVNVDDVTPDATLQSLGLDSLALVEVVFAIEEAFDVTVPFNANDPSGSEFDITTVAAVIEGVKSLLAGRG